MSILVGTVLRRHAKYRVTILSINFVKSVIRRVKSHVFIPFYTTLTEVNEVLYDMILVNK